VRSRIVKTNDELVNVDYLMHRNGNSWLISEIYLDGAISEVAILHPQKKPPGIAPIPAARRIVPDSRNVSFHSPTMKAST
jgi:hypothetical protein